MVWRGKLGFRVVVKMAFVKIGRGFARKTVNEEESVQWIGNYLHCMATEQEREKILDGYMSGCEGKPAKRFFKK